MNKKIITSAVLAFSTSLLLAAGPNDIFNTTNNSLNKNYVKKEVKNDKEVQKETKLIINEDFIRNGKLTKDFVEITGETEENFKIFIDQALKDKYFIEANEIFFTQTKNVEYPKDYSGNKNLSNKKIPNWKDSLDKLYHSATVNNNIIAAYQGQTMINNFFGLMAPNKKSAPRVIKNVMDKYMLGFTEKLKSKGYCYGYLYNMRYYLKYSGEVDKAIYVGDIGKGICKSQLDNKKIPEWLDSYFRRDYVQAKTFQYIRHEKNKQGLENF